MNDQELLTLAAKAADIKLSTDFHINGETYGGVWWNPLADDGDALRLAVRLEIWVHPDLKTVEAIGVKAVYEGNFSDPYIATRRAIVRAAATMASSGG